VIIMTFHIASEEEIKAGETTDIYFRRAKEILLKRNWDRPVVAEVSASSFPRGWTWGILAGLEEVAELLRDRELDVLALPEGEVFHPREPVIRIEGMYSEFCELETPLLGLACQASGIATAAARCKVAAGFKPVLSFGIRRMHPALSPMIDRSAYLGGCDGFSGIAGGRLIGVDPSGTIPHALMLIVGERKEVWRAFDEIIDKNVPRIMLVDTFSDEVVESLSAAQALGKELAAVRLDTPSSRRGDMRAIVEEVRWKLDVEGYSHVKRFVSGGLNESSLANLSDVADAFGVGTAISSARTIDFAMDIVEVDGRRTTKRGKLSGAKNLLECPSCFKRRMVLDMETMKCECGGEMRNLLRPFITGGTPEKMQSVAEVREGVLATLRERELKLEAEE
jgi:nicotinate phosphoribosyltransferase